MFDFNGDGRTDIGELFIGYHIFKDTTGGSQTKSEQAHGSRIDGWTVFVIVLFVWQILNILLGDGH